MGNWYESEIAKTILEKKYFHEGENFEGFVNRVSSIFSPSLKDDVADCLYSGDFFPAGRSLYGAGAKRKFKASMSNCYVLGKIPEDSIESIYGEDAKAARIFSYGGGVGINISTLRPKGAKVNNSAKTSTGAVSFIEKFNTTGNIIGSNNRRAALMIGLDCTHPDLEEFLKIKQTNHKLESANISILFTDDFMRAVVKWEPFKLTFDVPETGEHIEKTINAHEFFVEFCQTQWDWGDPGAIFIDGVRGYNLLSGYDEYKIEISNPCFTGDMRLLTSEGYKTFEELEGKQFKVISNDGEQSDGKVWCSGVKDTIILELSNGTKIKCTPDHIFMTIDKQAVKAKDMKGKQIMLLLSKPEYKNSSLFELLKRKAPRVRSIKQGGLQKVYDFTEPRNHWGVVEGCVVHNCAEFMSNRGNSCNLGSINLYHMVKNPFTESAGVDFDRLIYTTKIAVRALDEILDYGYDTQPLEMNRECIDDWRSIGLGVFGLADMLIALGLRYGSAEAINTTKEVLSTILVTALSVSAELAREKGTFGKYDWMKTKESPIIQRFEGQEIYEKIKKYGLRNGTLLSIAPTGSISLLCSESGGCEPLYQISYERTTHSMENDKKTFKVYAKSVEDLLAYHGLENPTDEQIKERFPFVVTSHEIHPKRRIEMQAAMQRYVDNAISSTVNLPNSATPDDIYKIYMGAWINGLKGITVFRDGCKRGNILGTTKSGTEKPIYNYIKPQKRRNIQKITGSTIRKSTACAKSMYITVNKSEGGDIFETFTNSSGGCTSNLGTITRLVSLALRSGICVDSIIGELKENKCQGCMTLRAQGKQVSQSCGNAIAEAIEEMHGKDSGDQTPYMPCPECGEKKMIAVGKCTECVNCGFSKCE